MHPTVWVEDADLEDSLKEQHAKVGDATQYPRCRPRCL